MNDYLETDQACILWEDVRGFTVVVRAGTTLSAAVTTVTVELGLYSMRRHAKFVEEWKQRRALKTAEPLEAAPEGWHFGDRVAHGPDRQIIRITREGDIVAIPVDTAAAVIPPSIIARLSAQHVHDDD